MSANICAVTPAWTETKSYVSVCVFCFAFYFVCKTESDHKYSKDALAIVAPNGIPFRLLPGPYIYIFSGRVVLQLLISKRSIIYSITMRECSSSTIRNNDDYFQFNWHVNLLCDFDVALLTQIIRLVAFRRAALTQRTLFKKMSEEWIIIINGHCPIHVLSNTNSNGRKQHNAKPWNQNHSYRRRWIHEPKKKGSNKSKLMCGRTRRKNSHRNISIFNAAAKNL